MLKFYAAAMRTMLADSSRPSGRPWLAELVCRNLRIILTRPEDESLEKLRRVIDAAGLPHPAVRKTTAKPVNYANVACLELAPTEADDTIIIYLHGGGYVFGSPLGYKGFLAQLALNSNARVIAVDYRLSPEHAFPAAQNDCLAVTEFLLQAHPTAKFILAGDSAGGALALATLKQLQQRINSPKVDGCVLISPWVDPWAKDGSIKSNAATDFLTEDWLTQSIDMHMQGNEDRELVSFCQQDLSFLPPTLVQSGGAEVFHDQIVELVERCVAGGVAVKHQITPSQFHVFQLLSPLFKDSRDAVAAVGDFINELTKPR